jgi:hypothetical protein
VEDRELRKYAVSHAVRNLKYSRAQIFLVLEPKEFHIGYKVFGGVVVALERKERWICVAYK